MRADADRRDDRDDAVHALAEEIERRRRPSWQTPFHWWGPTWREPVHRALGDLVRDGVLPGAAADLLRAFVEGGDSVVVAAGPAGVGKSTLADALVAALPSGTRRVYVRGSYETFDFLETMPPGRRALLINELSPHLPIYLWGEAARRVLQLGRDGAQLIGTIHADSPEEAIYQLARSPVGATPDEIAAIGTVVFLGPPSTPEVTVWAVSRIVRLSATAHGVRVEEVDTGA